MLYIVATDDAIISLAGQSAAAYCMGAEHFIDKLKSMKKAISHRVEAVVANANGQGQAMHLGKLQGTHFHNFGRNQQLIKDKWNRTKMKAVEVKEDDMKLTSN